MTGFKNITQVSYRKLFYKTYAEDIENGLEDTGREKGKLG